MARKISYYLDEHVAKAVARGLRQRGVDVLTVVEAGLLGAPDETHLAYALAAERVIFTQDDDFLRLHAVGKPHAGVVHAPQQTRIGDFIYGLMLIYQVLDADQMKGHLEYL